MINPTLAQAHLNKGEPAMVQPTPMVGNLMDAGTASKVALNPQQQISAQQLMTKVGQDADTAVIGKIAQQDGAMRTAQLKQSQAQQDAAQAVSTMIYASTVLILLPHPWPTLKPREEASVSCSN